MPKRTFAFGERDLPEVRLTPKERATLAAAARILGQVREMRQDSDDDLTTDIALAHHTCLELAEDVVVPNVGWFPIVFGNDLSLRKEN